MTAPESNLSDRDRAAAEKHTGRPAIASRTPIAPSGSRDQHADLRLCHRCHRPRHRRWRANRTRLIARCRSTTAGRPCRPSHRYRRRRPGSCRPNRLWLNRRQRRQPRRPTAHFAPPASARMAPLATSVTEPPEPPAPPSPATFSKIPLGSFIPPSPPWPPNEFVTSPNVARAGALVRHESAVDETHRQIAASATGAAIAASDIVITDCSHSHRPFRHHHPG